MELAGLHGRCKLEHRKRSAKGGDDAILNHPALLETAGSFSVRCWTRGGMHLACLERRRTARSRPRHTGSTGMPSFCWRMPIPLEEAPTRTASATL